MANTETLSKTAIESALDRAGTEDYALYEVPETACQQMAELTEAAKDEFSYTEVWAAVELPTEAEGEFMKALGREYMSNGFSAFVRISHRAVTGEIEPGKTAVVFRGFRWEPDGGPGLERVSVPRSEVSAALNRAGIEAQYGTQTLASNSGPGCQGLTIEVRKTDVPRTWDALGELAAGAGWDEEIIRAARTCREMTPSHPASLEQVENYTALFFPGFDWVSEYSPAW